MKKFIPLFMMIMLILGGCGSSNKSTSTEAVETSKDVYIMAGRITGNDEVNLTSKITAKVTQVAVDVGTKVNKGDPLVYLDVKEMEAQVKQAEASVAAAQANLDKAENGARSEQITQAKAVLDNAKTNYDRMKILFDQGAVPKQQLENAELQYTNAQQQLNILSKESPENIRVYDSQVAQAEALLEYYKTQMSNGAIVSPISGTVSLRNIDPGNMASTSAILLKIVNSDQLLINAFMPAEFLDQIKVGQELTIHVTELPDKKIDGEITAISPAIDSANRDVLVKVLVKTSDQAIKPGMFGSIGIKK